MLSTRDWLRLSSVNRVLMIIIVLSIGPSILSDANADQNQSSVDLAAARRLVVENPSDLDANMSLGNACYEAGLYDEALGLYHHILELDPDNIEAIVNIGVIHLDNNRPQEALTRFEQAVSLNKNDLSVMCNLAQAHYALGDVEKAVKQLVQAIDLQQDCQPAHFLLGIYFAEANIYIEALREWQTVVDIDPTTAEAVQAKSNIALLESMIASK